MWPLETKDAFQGGVEGAFEMGQTLSCRCDAFGVGSSQNIFLGKKKTFSRQELHHKANEVVSCENDMI